MRYMLDTDICIYAINDRPERVLRALRSHEAAGLGVSAVTAAERFYGVARTGSERNLRALRQFLAPLEIAPFDREPPRSAVRCVPGSPRKARRSGPTTPRSQRTPTRSASRW